MKKNFKNDEIVSVLTTEPIGKMLAYKVPHHGCALGAFALVPLGHRVVLGVVWSVNLDEISSHKVKKIKKILDFNPMSLEMMEFIERFASYTITPLSAVFRLVTRVNKLGSESNFEKKYLFVTDKIKRLTIARKKVLEFMKLNADLKFNINEITKKCAVSPSVVYGLEAINALEVNYYDRDKSFPKLDLLLKGKQLSKDQKFALEKIRGSKRHNAILLKGVTGSGKTEVYLESIADCIKQNKQALVLLPEIGLTSEFLSRVEERFGAMPGEWHSGISLTNRRRVWKSVSKGDVQLIVGARSALFLPFKDLGLIVVDEEHDHSYKQDDGVLYNARDMAVLRGVINSARVILASATPSLESWVNVEKGKYLGVDLSFRYGGALIPKIKTIDMRLEKLERGNWISPTLVDQIRERLIKGEQSLLFLNRRGFAPITLCQSCGEQVSCNQCDSRMVQHKKLNRIMCHQCGNINSIPEKCTTCGSQGTLSAIGPGIERLGIEVQRLFSDAKIAVLSSDLQKTAIVLKEQLIKIAHGEIDIVVGTQLIAKGHNFPNLTLVGVIDADLGLQGADLRAAEKTFQMISQVSGRAGRDLKAGETFIQTYQPDHRVIKAIVDSDLEDFWRLEAIDRKKAKVPPFGRFVSIIIYGVNLKKVEEVGRALLKNGRMLRALGIQVFGPAPAPISRIKGMYRNRMLIKADLQTSVQKPLRDWVLKSKTINGVKIKIDIDPYNFL